MARQGQIYFKWLLTGIQQDIQMNSGLLVTGGHASVCESKRGYFNDLALKGLYIAMLAPVMVLLPTPSIATQMQNPANVVVTVESESDVERTFRLFMLEEAYTQKKGEWQFRLTPLYLKITEHEREPTYSGMVEETHGQAHSLVSNWAIEFGLTDRFELTAAIPIFMRADSKVRIQEFDSDTLLSSTTASTDNNGYGDLSLGIVFGILGETRRRPALSLEMGLSVPTGEKSKGFGSGSVGRSLGLAATKRFGSTFATTNIEFAVDDDEHRFEYGIGLLYLIGETGWSFAVEMKKETEKNLGTHETENSLRLLPSVTYSWEGNGDREWQFGLGFPVESSDIAGKSDVIGTALQLQVEF